MNVPVGAVDGAFITSNTVTYNVWAPMSELEEFISVNVILLSPDAYTQVGLETTPVPLNVAHDDDREGVMVSGKYIFIIPAELKSSVMVILKL